MRLRDSASTSQAASSFELDVEGGKGQASKAPRQSCSSWHFCLAVPFIILLWSLRTFAGEQLMEYRAPDLKPDVKAKIKASIETKMKEMSQAGRAARAEPLMKPVGARAEMAATTSSENGASSVVGAVVVQFGDEGDLPPVQLALHPEWSESSAAFWREAARVNCKGTLYRNEGDTLLQGRLDCPLKVPVSKGACPVGVAVDPNRRCPAHDPQCGCHGPIMQRGDVGWAGGGTGPDFFIYTGIAPATWWSHDHTLIGRVQGETSWAALRRLHAMRAHNDRGMTMLDKSVRLQVMPAAV